MCVYAPVYVGLDCIGGTNGKRKKTNPNVTATSKINGKHPLIPKFCRFRHFEPLI